LTTSEAAGLVAEALQRLLGFAREQGIHVMVEAKGEWVDIAQTTVEEVTRTPGALALEKRGMESYGRPSEDAALPR
jgi:hypothetical protein